MPALSVLYLLAIIDRANIGALYLFWHNGAAMESNVRVSNVGNAKIEGLEASLGMDGTDYNVAVAVFFVSYVIFGVWRSLS